MTARTGQRVCAVSLTILLHITIETSPELGRCHRVIFICDVEHQQLELCSVAIVGTLAIDTPRIATVA